MNKNDQINHDRMDRPETTPVFIYALDSDEAEVIRTSAPISPGDYLSFKMSDGTFVNRKRVKCVHHLEYTGQIQSGYLTSQVELDD